MRVLLTRELGLNLAHLTRLLPLAQKLKADGHVVLAAVRDNQVGSTSLDLVFDLFGKKIQASGGAVKVEI